MVEYLLIHENCNDREEYYLVVITGRSVTISDFKDRVDIVDSVVAGEITVFRIIQIIVEIILQDSIKYIAVMLSNIEVDLGFRIFRNSIYQYIVIESEEDLLAYTLSYGDDAIDVIQIE